MELSQPLKGKFIEVKTKLTWDYRITLLGRNSPTSQCYQTSFDYSKFMLFKHIGILKEHPLLKSVSYDFSLHTDGFTLEDQSPITFTVETKGISTSVTFQGMFIVQLIIQQLDLLSVRHFIISVLETIKTYWHIKISLYNWNFTFFLISFESWKFKTNHN